MERAGQEMTATILFPLYACVSDEMGERDDDDATRRRLLPSFLPSFLPVFSVRCSYFRTATDGGKSSDWLGSHSHYSSCMSNYSSNVLPSELTMLQISALWVFTYRNRHWLRGARAWNLCSSRPEAEDCGDNSERTFAVTLLQECAAKSVSSQFGGCRYIHRGRLATQVHEATCHDTRSPLAF